MKFSTCILLSLPVVASAAALSVSHARGITTPRAAVSMGPCLHGSPQSRSPLVNWLAEEMGISLTMMPPRPSKHPFNQVPFLTDEGGVEIFESGAIVRCLTPVMSCQILLLTCNHFSAADVFPILDVCSLCAASLPGRRLRPGLDGGTTCRVHQMGTIACLSNRLPMQRIQPIRGALCYPSTPDSLYT